MYLCEMPLPDLPACVAGLWSSGLGMSVSPGYCYPCWWHASPGKPRAEPEQAPVGQRDEASTSPTALLGLTLLLLCCGCLYCIHTRSPRVQHVVMGYMAMGASSACCLGTEGPAGCELARWWCLGSGQLGEWWHWCECPARANSWWVPPQLISKNMKFWEQRKRGMRGVSSSERSTCVQGLCQG